MTSRGPFQQTVACLLFQENPYGEEWPGHVRETSKGYLGVEMTNVSKVSCGAAIA